MQSDRDEADASDDGIFNPDDEELLSFPYNASSSAISKDIDSSRSASNSKNSSRAGSPKSTSMEIDDSTKKNGEKATDFESGASLTKDDSGKSNNLEAEGHTKSSEISEQSLLGKSTVITKALTNEEKAKTTNRILQ